MNSDRPSAIIYEFPPRGRMAGARDNSRFANVSMQQSAQIDFGGWYHEEAVREEENAKDRH